MPLPPSSLSADQAVPAGVPVMMTMPGLSVKLREKKWMSSAQLQIMFEVLLDCRSSPLMRDITLRFCGSAISSAVTMQGPSGAPESNALPEPSSYQVMPSGVRRTWRSRAVTSLTMV